jgi:broad specificity phosphatase PhoE
MAGRFGGRSDPLLNDAGQRQIAMAAKTILIPPEVIYASDLQRAQQSAHLIALHFGVLVRLRPSLREIDFGQWEGLSWPEIEEAFLARPRRGWTNIRTGPLLRVSRMINSDARL